jgi:hypothetical protein
MPSIAQQYKYETPMPPGVASTDKADTSIGTLNLSYGYPDGATEGDTPACPKRQMTMMVAVNPPAADQSDKFAVSTLTGMMALTHSQDQAAPPHDKALPFSEAASAIPFPRRKTQPIVVDALFSDVYWIWRYSPGFPPILRSLPGR